MLTFFPSSKYVPSVCLSIQPNIYNKVDFPEPDTPTIEQKSPFSIIKLILFNASTSIDLFAL